jgi:hypothetical protein
MPITYRQIGTDALFFLSGKRRRGRDCSQG